MSKTKIFFSYAWGDAREAGDSREKIVNELYDSLQKDGYELVRDKVDLGYKGFISDFMKDIGTGSKIIVVISDKYVRSPFCMYELYEIGRNSNFDRNVFSAKIFPIMVEFIDFSRPKIINEYLDFWQQEQKEWEDLFQKRMGQLAPGQFERYNKVKLIGQNIGTLMDWIADMNTLNSQMLSNNDFAAIKKALGKAELEEKIPNPKPDTNGNITVSSLDVLKQDLIAMIDELQYDAVFEKIAQANLTYNKGIFSQFKMEYMAGNKDYMFASRLKTFVNGIK